MTRAQYNALVGNVANVFGISPTQATTYNRATSSDPVTDYASGYMNPQETAAWTSYDTAHPVINADYNATQGLPADMPYNVAIGKRAPTTPAEAAALQQQTDLYDAFAAGTYTPPIVSPMR